MSQPTTEIRVLFTDFWGTFRVQEFWLYQVLNKHFRVKEDAIDPDLVVFCDYGLNHLKYECLKVYYSHEVIDPSKRKIVRDHRLCDYSFSFHGDRGNHQYFSLLVEDPFFEQIRSSSVSPELGQIRNTPKTKFCNFVYGNDRPQERIRFCQQLMAYKHVDCPGKVLNNHPSFDAHGYKYERKYEFLSRYKFTIAFENQSQNNYTTEKIFHPFVAGSVPIYWGNPEVARLFNPKSFINCHDFGSFAEVVEWVGRVDNQDDLFEAYRREPPILPSSPLYELSSEFLATRVHEIARAAKTGQSVSRSFVYPLARWAHFFRTKICSHMLYRKQRLQESFANAGKRTSLRSRLAS